MRLSRVWAMPSPETFTIKPVREIIERYMTAGERWIDPFCRNSIFKGRCIYTNDLNPKFAGTHNLDALDFLKQLPADEFDGVLFDPPFSPRQAKEEYAGFGATEGPDTSRRFYSEKKREAARVLKVWWGCHRLRLELPGTRKEKRHEDRRGSSGEPRRSERHDHHRMPENHFNAQF